MRFVKLPGAALALLFALAAAAAQEQRVHSRVLFVPDPGSRTTSFHMIIQAGRADEGPDLPSGIAHYLEHVILGGRNAEHADAAVRMFPGSFANGTTSVRTTTYLHNVPAERTKPEDALDQLFGFYAARLKGFEMAPADAERGGPGLRADRVGHAQPRHHVDPIVHVRLHFLTCTEADGERAVAGKGRGF